MSLLSLLLGGGVPRREIAGLFLLLEQHSTDGVGAAETIEIPFSQFWRLGGPEPGARCPASGAALFLAAAGLLSCCIRTRRRRPCWALLSWD